MRLILTADGSSAGGLKGAGIADIVVSLELRLVWGPVPSKPELAAFVAPRTEQRPGSHWLDYGSPRYMQKFGGRDFGLIELCQRCETVELWFETEPNSQLVLIWLLNYLRSYAKTASLVLRHIDATLGDAESKQLAKWSFAGVEITNDHLAIASLAWQAYRAPTPQDWFNLMSKDLSVLPQLQPTVIELLEELPMLGSGLGATEMRILELISEGNASPPNIFPGDEKANRRRAFSYWEVGFLLDELAQCPAPAVSGLAEGPFTPEMHDDRDRHERYKRSRLSSQRSANLSWHARMISGGATRSTAGGAVLI